MLSGGMLLSLEPKCYSTGTRGGLSRLATQRGPDYVTAAATGSSHAATELSVPPQQ